MKTLIMILGYAFGFWLVWRFFLRPIVMSSPKH